MREVLRLRLATDEGTPAKRADRMWQVACDALGMKGAGNGRVWKDQDTGRAYRRGWTDAVEWLRRHADARAGKWSGKEPSEALNEAAAEMERIGDVQ
ncbi:MAG: hypothetical protein ICV73_20570 [Acetobacteraceae bacterium]|nr:hypothetical protein [Acetobacteraceae bacterium]